MAIYQILPLLLLFPLLGAFINGTIGKRLPKLVVGSIATLAPALSFILAITIFSQLHEPVKSVLFPIINLKTIHLDFALYADNLSIWMTTIVTGVGTLIHLFSIGYMHDDKTFYKFFTFMNLFIFTMLLLVLGSNYFVLFFGWEGVGVCSYLLIGYYYQDEKVGLQNGIAGQKSFILNRIGELGMLIAMFLILSVFGSLEYDDVYNAIKAGTMPTSAVMTIITLCLFLGATGKSAQIPLFTWLPDAMAGPTPVSALIHAATMVTAGIFLLIRSNFLYELVPFAKDVVLWIGLVTSIVAAYIALRQNDIKKVLAYSTVSQLGLIFVALGMGAYTVAMFHVTTHAFFKALLFLGAGSIIHAMNGEQDMRKMGGLKDKMKITHITFLLATLSITGFPLFAGFFSKDEILGIAFGKDLTLYILLVISIAMTAVYMFRLYYVVFYGKPRMDAETEAHIHEAPKSMTIPLMILGVLSVIGGIVDLPGLFIKNGAHFLDNLLNANTLGLNEIHESHPDLGTTLILMAVAIATCVVVLFISYLVYGKKGIVPEPMEEMTGWQKFSARKMYWDEVYDFLFVKPIEWLGKALNSIVEVLVLNNIIKFLVTIVDQSGNLIRKWETGKVNSYIFWMVVGIIAFVSYYLIKL